MEQDQIKNPEVGTKEELSALIKKENLEAFVKELNASCAKYQCKLVASVTFVDGLGMSFNITPVNQ